ncbi:MAG: glycosyltransferase [Pseudomonadota bacterium]
MRLTVVAPAPAHAGENGWWLDTKFLVGMEHYVRAWPGPVTAVLAEAQAKPPFATFVRSDDLPFAVSTFTPGLKLAVERIPADGLVLCGGDEAEFVHLSAACAERGQPVILVLEYTLETRLRIAWLDQDRGVLRKLRTTQWSMAFERRRKAAIRRAAGLQCNAYPTFDTYGHLNPQTMMYLDNRITEDLLVRPEEQAARAARLAAGGPLTLVYSGRLERLKGAQDLVPVAAGLAARGVDFVLHVFGPGSLSDEIRSEAVRHGLSERVILRGTVDFAKDLVPFVRSSADLFLSCHRQSDPSCTYLETLGCGVPVIGYANRMWARLQGQSNGGWTVPMGETGRVADLIAELDRDRPALVSASAAARAFAARHLFGAEFAQRIAHMRQIAGC